DRQLHRGGVAAGVADLPLPLRTPAGQLRQTVVPAVVEAVVGREVDDHGVGPGRLQRLHERRRLAVGQGQHHRVGALGRDRGGIERLEPQLAGIGVAVCGDAEAVKLARGYEGVFEVRMRGRQPDQLAAGVAAGADDAEGDGGLAHGRASSRDCRFLRTAGHSVSRMENTTVSRNEPSAWRLALRSTPSWRAPRRAIAVREAWLNQLVSKLTFTQPRVSNACPSSISLHSVLSPVRCTRGAYQV